MKFSYVGYVQKRSKHEPTDSSFSPEIQIAKCMMSLYFLVSPAITQMTNMQKMNKHDSSKQNIPNLHVCSMEERK